MIPNIQIKQKKMKKEEEKKKKHNYYLKRDKPTSHCIVLNFQMYQHMLFVKRLAYCQCFQKHPDKKGVLCK